MRYISGQPKSPSNRPNREKSKVFDSALWYLGRREQTKSDLEKKLLKRSFDPLEVKEAILRLEQLGFVDDLRFAKNFISCGLSGRGKGKRRIIFELKRKGIREEDIAKAIEESWPDNEEEIVAREARRAVEKNMALDRQKNFTRSLAYLMRRGFPYDISKKAVLSCLDKVS